MKHLTRRCIALVMAVLIAISVLPQSSYAKEASYADRYVVLSLEGLTLGQGFYIPPMKLSYEEIKSEWDNIGVQIDIDNLTVSQATYAFFAKSGLKTDPALGSNYTKNDFYLSSIADIDNGSINIPASIKNAYKSIHNSEPVLSEKTGADLSEFDYTDTSGWMVSVDNQFINSGAGSCVLSDNMDNDHTNVIRWQYSMFDYGSDIGIDNLDESEGIPAYFTNSDRSVLYTLFADNYELIKSDAGAYNEIMTVMSEPSSSDNDINSAISRINVLLNNGYVDVEIKMNATSKTMTLEDASGNDVSVGEPQGYVYNLKLKPDTYTLTGYAADGETVNGTLDIAVSKEPSQTFTVYTATNIYCTNSGWIEGTDYEISHTIIDINGDLRRTSLGMQAQNSDRSSALCLSGDTLSVTVTPLGDKAGNYLSNTASATITANRSFGFNIAAQLKRTVTITVPKGAELTTGKLTNSFSYSVLNPAASPVTDESEGTDTYTYIYANGTTYYYKVSMEGAVTYWNWVSVKEDSSFTVTDEDLYINDDLHNPDTVIDDLTENKYDVADIYMNVNSRGFLNIAENDSARLECYRNWQAIEGISNAKIAEPDFHYTVIDEFGNISNDVVTVVPGNNSAAADIKAVGKGTAIILVTYDAMTNAASQSFGGSFFSAIWPENTGVLVVNVGESTDIDTGMTINKGLNTAAGKMSADNIDAELDVLYYTDEENGASYTFTPESDVTVSVLRPYYTYGRLSYKGYSTSGVTYNNDGSVTVTELTHGSNIIKLTKGGHSVYQVIRAKKTAVEYAYTDSQGNAISKNELKAGCNVQITFGERNALNASCKGIYIPANKLAGIYNMSGTINITDSYGNEFRGKSNQYLFANTVSAQTVNVTIPKYFTGDTYKLSGNIYENGFGSEYGLHRELTHEKGKTPQFTALSREGYFGKLPDISLSLSETVFNNIGVTVKDADSNEGISNYTLVVKDGTGNISYVTDGSFATLDGEEYTYEIYTPGYCFAQGKVSGEALKEGRLLITLQKAGAGSWDGMSSLEPKCNDSGIYQIKTGAELSWFANKVNSGSTELFAELSSDIDLAEYRWTPIGTNSKPFSGEFNGNGHTISGLYVYDTAYAGLFGSSKGIIQNVTVQGEIITTKSNAGGISGGLKKGTVQRPATIKNCVSFVNISAETGENIGGIAGNCTASDIIVTGCSNYGNITAQSYAGGIIGYYKASALSGAGVSDCYNAGMITGADSGMIIGSNNECAINNCYHSVDVQDNNSEYINMLPVDDIRTITLDNVQKPEHYDIVCNAYPIYEKLLGIALCDTDKDIISGIPVLIDTMENQKEVTVEAIDYTAKEAGLLQASENGVIVSCKVWAVDASDAIKKSLSFNNIDYVMSDGYISSINGLGHIEDYYMSGWMLSYNDDDCDNYGMDYITLSDNDKLSLCYSLTGGDDIAAAYTGLPTLKELTVGGISFGLRTQTDYDEYWNPSYAYFINDEELEGEGTQDNPFVINVRLPYGSKLTDVPVSYSLYAHPYFAHANGISDNMDMTNDVSFSVSSIGGRTAHYIIKSSVTAQPTAAPTDIPTSMPTSTPYNEPTSEPTKLPTAEPTAEPVKLPTVEPTAVPTGTQADAPTVTPSKAPQDTPSVAPTDVPQNNTPQVLKKGDLIKDKKGRTIYKVTRVKGSRVIVKYHKTLKNKKNIKIPKYMYTKDGIRCKVNGFTKKAIKSFKKNAVIRVPKEKYRFYYKLLKKKKVVLKKI